MTSLDTQIKSNKSFHVSSKKLNKGDTHTAVQINLREVIVDGIYGECGLCFEKHSQEQYFQYETEATFVSTIFIID